MLSKSEHDHKDFKTIIKILDIYPKKETTGYTIDEIKNSTSKRFPRYVKDKDHNPNGTPMQLHTNNIFGKQEVKSDNNGLREMVNKYIKGELNRNQFEQELNKNQFNPQVEEIQKILRHSNEGVYHSHLMFNVMRFSES